MPDISNAPVTVADWIAEFVHLVRTRPPTGCDGVTREQHNNLEDAVRKMVVAAIEHYGNVVWQGQVVSTIAPPRLNLVNFAPCGGTAENLVWPLPVPEPPPQRPAAVSIPPLPARPAGGTTVVCPACGANVGGHTGYYDPATDVLTCRNCHPPTIVHNFLGKKE